MNIKTVLLVALTVILYNSCSRDSGQNHSKIGHIETIDSLIQSQIEAHHIAGAVIQVKKGDSILHRDAYGYANEYSYDMQPLEHPEKMTTKHLFDLASLTKVCATTFGIMKLVDMGKIHIDDPISNYLPGFSKGEKAKITVRNLLTHTAGLYQWVPTYYHASNTKERYEYIAKLPLKWKVGAGRHYSDLGFMLLGDIIHHVSGMPLDQFVKQNIYGPLNLQHTAFNPLDKGFKRIAATSHGNPFEKHMIYDDDFGYKVNEDPKSWDKWRQYTLKGQVNDGNSWYASDGVAGHAGLFSTVDDLQVLVDLLLHEGRFEKKQIISSSVIDTFLRRDRYGNGLGWAMDPDVMYAKGAPPGSFGHTGFTGTNIVAVPRDSLSIILLTNRQNVGLQKNGYYFNLGPLRQAIFDTVYSSIED
ncbi:MAG: serine hydrolase [Balneolaceae bacterium]|jgi:CubicO group peptidase (beta-lactamase class C family)